MTFKSVISNTFCKLHLLAVSCLVAAVFSSCDAIYDNREDCVHGIQIKFVFDYHMERGANAFPSNVDCVSVYVFDKTGAYIGQYTETSEALREDHYRMILPLPEGDYRLMVYGGLSCDKPTFNLSTPWEARADATPHHQNMIVSLPLDSDGVSSKKLHDFDEREGGLFYGFQFRRAGADQWTNSADTDSKTIEITVTNEDFGTSYTEYEVNLIKDTNNIQVMLQEIASPYEVNYEDFEFTIIDDNFKLDSYNYPIHIATDDFQPIYRPFHGENRIMGYANPSGREGTQLEQDDERPVQVGCVEFSTSRLHVDHLDTARLVVKSTKEHNSDGSLREIINIPLITYLSSTRGFGSSWIRSDQEYLDRQSNWTLFFFLQSGRWLTATVAVNSWIVRVNDIQL